MQGQAGPSWDRALNCEYLLGGRRFLGCVRRGRKISLVTMAALRFFIIVAGLLSLNLSWTAAWVDKALASWEPTASCRKEWKASAVDGDESHDRARDIGGSRLKCRRDETGTSWRRGADGGNLKENSRFHALVQCISFRVSSVSVWNRS